MINARILTLAAALAALPLSAEIRTETRNGAHVLVVDAPEGSSAARKANFHLKTMTSSPLQESISERQSGCGARMSELRHSGSEE